MLKSVDLAWIVVSDFKKARKFFTETIGLKEHSCSEEHGWVELCGADGGTMIGLAQKNEESDQSGVAPGGNAIITITVDNLAETISEFKKKKVKLIGDVMEVPGHVKLQMFTDADGNRFQLVETLY